MKQKLFEHTGGNRFKLITESVDVESHPYLTLIREGLKKVFSNGGKKLSYTQLANIGMGYIKNVNEARKCAMQEARDLASEYGYVDNEGQSQFVKEFQRADGTDTSEPPRSPEKREVRIGEDIIRYATEISDRSDVEELKAKIIELANELIQMHGGK
jgi:hypothetical protein